MRYTCTYNSLMLGLDHNSLLVDYELDDGEINESEENDLDCPVESEAWKITDPLDKLWPREIPYKFYKSLKLRKSWFV